MYLDFTKYVYLVRNIVFLFSYNIYVSCIKRIPIGLQNLVEEKVGCCHMVFFFAFISTTSLMAPQKFLKILASFLHRLWNFFLNCDFWEPLQPHFDINSTLCPSSKSKTRKTFFKYLHKREMCDPINLVNLSECFRDCYWIFTCIILCFGCF